MKFYFKTKIYILSLLKLFIFFTLLRMGDSLNLTCESGLASPSPSLEWLLEGRRLQDGVRALDTLYPTQESRYTRDRALDTLHPTKESRYPSDRALDTLHPTQESRYPSNRARDTLYPTQESRYTRDRGLETLYPT